VIEADGVPEAEIVIDRGGVKTESGMKIDLLCFGEPPGTAAVQKLRRSLMAVVADVLDEQIGGRSEFPFKREGGFKSGVSC